LEKIPRSRITISGPTRGPRTFPPSLIAPPRRPVPPPPHSHGRVGHAPPMIREFRASHDQSTSPREKLVATRPQAFAAPFRPPILQYLVAKRPLLKKSGAPSFPNSESWPKPSPSDRLPPVVSRGDDRLFLNQLNWGRGRRGQAGSGGRASFKKRTLLSLRTAIRG